MAVNAFKKPENVKTKQSFVEWKQQTLETDISMKCREVSLDVRLRRVVMVRVARRQLLITHPKERTPRLT